MSSTDSGEYGDNEETITFTNLNKNEENLIKFYIDKEGKRWKFLKKITSLEDLELICDKYLIKILDERSDRIRYCCKYTFDYLCPFRAVMVRRKATLFTRYEHNHPFGIENEYFNDQNNDTTYMSSSPLIIEELINFKLNSIQDELQNLAEQLSLSFKIFDECPIFIGNISSQFGSMLSLTDKNTNILITEFRNFVFVKEEIWTKEGGSKNFLNLLQEKCEMFFDVVDVIT
ncbi:hypothetical protein Mgra_00008117 [Meloidogyne graminicola]|uniref:FLYWCH-type domain-containing protein n=1 Tax=Meloidogyne graminicola TaxID=189291 RepID=A0A8S9ZGR4_9BILA|nr:hypothetical protein Mgra_00008117 [Meloidogyne graminicola]